MEQNEQIFLDINQDGNLVEFLLTDQPMRMIKADMVSKSDIELTVASGFTEDYITYSKSFLHDDNFIDVIHVTIDVVLRTVEEIEKDTF